MSVFIFDNFLSSDAMIAVFDDAAIVQGMLRFEQALAQAQAAQGLLPHAAAQAIANACDVRLYDIAALLQAGRRAGSLAIPLVGALTSSVALHDAKAAQMVHWGATSQDAIDTAMVLATRNALRLLDQDLSQLGGKLAGLAGRHLATPVLARTLMQPAQVSSLGFKLAGWLAPLVRARTRLRECAARALRLQLGGAVGTLAVMGDAGPQVALRAAASLGLEAADAAWHTQRDEWLRLGLEVALLAGSLGKLATDLSLMAQGEIGELAEPAGDGRGASSAMPHKRNPVAAMIALAAATRTPQHAAALLASMGQQHERGLGNWQAELAQWPALFLSAHGALQALNDAIGGLRIDTARMLDNIEAQQGLVYAEAVAAELASVIGKPAAHSLLERLSSAAVASGRHLASVLNDEHGPGRIDPARLAALFDPVAATGPGHRLAQQQLASLRHDIAALDAVDFYQESTA